VKAAIPDAATVTLDQGKRILREEALKEFQQAAKDMESQVAAARTKIQALGANASQAEHQAAMQHLQSIQSTHTEQLKTIAAQLEDRLAAWEQVKRQ
ncbi:MAG TPA: hypothetical protein VN673_12875, partial [Clostridia bacterium]|nr:hypothetical protein [Clostridia bacterium]